MNQPSKTEPSYIYRSSDDFIQKQLEMVKEIDRPKRRLELDIADIFIGPTSSGNAQYLSESLCKSRDPKEIAERMQEVATRYLKSIKKKKK